MTKSNNLLTSTSTSTSTVILIKAVQHLDEGVLCCAQAVDAVTLGVRGALYIQQMCK